MIGLLFTGYSLLAFQTSEITHNSAMLDFNKLDKTQTYIISMRQSIKEKMPPELKKYAVSHKINTPITGSAINADNIVIHNGKPQPLAITGLMPATAYTVDVYADGKDIASYRFLTVAVPPTEQASQIAFTNVTSNSLWLRWKKGNGENRIVLMKKDGKPALPLNGADHVSVSTFNDKVLSIDGNGTLVVYNSANDMNNKGELRLEGLEKGEYHFMVCEYNGTAETANYLTTPADLNPRAVELIFDAPVALSAAHITNDSFTAKWKKMEGVDKYLFDLSYKEDFSEPVGIYNGIDFGTVTEIPVNVPDDSKKVYYYRVRAVKGGRISSASNIIKVVLK